MSHKQRRQRQPLELIPSPEPLDEEAQLRLAEAKIAARRAAEPASAGLTAIAATLAQEAAELAQLRRPSGPATSRASRQSPNSENAAASSESKASSTVCGQCRDSGIRATSESEAVVDHLVVVEWFETGLKRVPLVFCTCEIGQDRAWRWSGLPDEARDVSLEQLWAIPDQLEALEVIEAFIERPVGYCTLVGLYGVGKTTLFYAALRELSKRGVYGAYRSAPDMLDELRAAIGDDSKGTMIAKLQRLKEIPILAIDELDKANCTDWAFEQLQKLFEYRHRERNRLGTLIGYNLDRAEQIPGYLNSRIRDGRYKYVEMRGSDVRPAMFNEPAVGNDPRHVWDRGGA